MDSFHINQIIAYYVVVRKKTQNNPTKKLYSAHLLFWDRFIHTWTQNIFVV